MLKCFVFAKIKNFCKNENGKKHIFAVLICTVVFCVIAIFCTIIMVVSNNYNKIFDMPRAINGIADYSDFSFEGRSTKPSLAGEWEFFYNKWIVTDKLDNIQPDKMIEVPSKWTDSVIDGKRINASGYASYRLTLKNLPANTHINTNITPKANIVYRSFINGVLNETGGMVSKEKSKNLMTGFNTSTEHHITQTLEDVVIVYEVGNSGLGGLVSPPKLSLMIDGLSEIRDPGAAARYTWINNVPFIVFGIMLTLVFMQLVMSLAIYGKKKELTGFFLVAAMLLHFLFTKDMFIYVARIINTAPFIFYFLNYLTAFCVLAAFATHLCRTKTITIKKPLYFASLAILGIAYLLCSIFIGNKLLIISFVVTVLAGGLFLYPLATALMDKKEKPKIYTLVYIILFSWLMLLFALQGFDALGILVYGLETAASYGLLGTMIALSVIYLLKMRSNTLLSLRIAEYEKEYNEIKHAAMRGQIKPHFIFNSLTSIQDRYHKGIEEGDEALSLFSKHLRLNADADLKDLIPFEDELVNINNYFNLERLRFRNLTLLFDINYTEFVVPILGLQPLIENSIKYAGTEKSKDGFIKISSTKENDKIILTVEDNGKGFDQTTVKENSQGLKNVTARFSYYLNAETVIKSELGKGTEIEIIIPLKENAK